MKTTRTVTYVAPPTITSMILAFVNALRAITKRAVAMMMATNRARIDTRLLQTMTGANSSMTTIGAINMRARRAMNVREGM